MDGHALIVPDGCPRQIAVNDKDVWTVVEARGAVVEIDARTGSLVRVIHAGVPQPISAFAFGALAFVSNLGDDTITKIRAATGNVLKVIS